MKKLKYILAAALTAVTMSTAFTGCQDNEIFDVNAPGDLDARIDEAASRIAERERLAREAEEAKRNAILEKLQDDVYQVGNTENGGPFWQTFSKSYKILSTDDAFMIKFKNFTSGANTYHNFGVVVTNDVEHLYGDGSVYPAGPGYVEYAVVRADNFKNWAWGNENGEGWNTENDSGAEQRSRLKTSYDATEAEDKKFSEQMEGADCEVLITRAGDTINMSFTMTTWAGATLTKSFFLKESGIADKDIRVFLITEKGHFVVYKVSAEPLEVPAWSKGVIFTEDQKDDEGISKVDPRWRINSLGEVASLVLDNYKKAIVHLDEAEVSEKSVEKIITSYIFDKKTSTAKLVYKNGAELECETSKISFFSSDDFTTPGEKTIYATYNAKSGEREVPVMTSFTVTVTPPISSIEVEAVSTTYYYAPGTTTPPTKADINAASFIKSVIGKTGVVDIPISAEDYTVEVTSEPTSMSGKFVITVTYKDLSTTLEVKLEESNTENLILTGTIVGSGKFVTDEVFGKVFENDNSAQRTSYLLLPEGSIPDCSKTKAMSISFWVNGNGKAALYSPIFSAYGAAPNNNKNTFPMFIIQGRGLLQTNCSGWTNFEGTEGKIPINDNGAKNVEDISYLKDNKWHLVTITITDTHAEFIVDEKVINSWTYDGTEGKNATGFLTDGHSSLKYICLGGNQAWDWSDYDSGYKYANFKIYNRVLTKDEIAARVTKKE